MTTYVLETTRPVSVEEAHELGKTLAVYQIDVINLQVWHIWPDGSRHRDLPTARTIEDVAGSFAAGSALSPVAVPLIGLLPWLAPLWAILAALAGSIGALNRVNRTLPDPRAVTSEVLFALGNVSAKRARWAEDLLGAFCAIHQWRFSNPRFPSAANNGARRRRMPTPWAHKQR